MKLVTAVIKPFKLDDVREALSEIGVQGITVTRVQGHGGEPEMEEVYRGAKIKIELHDKVLLEIGVSEAFVDPTVETILKAARTGEVGDGKIFVLPVERIYRIRTGEVDHAAVTPVRA